MRRRLAGIHRSVEKRRDVADQASTLAGQIMLNIMGQRQTLRADEQRDEQHNPGCLMSHSGLICGVIGQVSRC